jgi:hypothetical protein
MKGEIQMFKIHQKYTDFEGHDREEDLYFNFTEPQLREFLDKEPTFSEKSIANLVATKDPKQMLEALQKLFIAAYGEKSEDGKVFKKNKEITENFACSAAFAQIVDDIMYKGDIGLVKSFIINIFPAKFTALLEDEVNKLSDNAAVVEG